MRNFSWFEICIVASGQMKSHMFSEGPYFCVKNFTRRLWHPFKKNPIWYWFLNGSTKEFDHPWVKGSPFRKIIFPFQFFASHSPWKCLGRMPGLTVAIMFSWISSPCNQFKIYCVLQPCYPKSFPYILDGCEKRTNLYLQCTVQCEILYCCW